MPLNPPTRELVATIRRHRLTYRSFIKYCSVARHHVGLKPEKRGHRLPHLIPADALTRFYETIDRAGDLQHQIMLRLLFFTAVRVSELASIKRDDVDLGEYKIFIERGKGDKDRYILFPDSFRLALQAHMRSTPLNKYLFESKRRSRFSSRQIERIVQHYARVAEMPVRVHPHLFRHQMLTHLTKSGLTDAQIQLISGHASKKSLERYQHMGLETTVEDYQAAMKKVKI